MSEVKSVEERVKKYKAKTNPLTLGAVISDAHRVQIDRWKVWAPLLTNIEGAVKRILNEEGVLGCMRVTYYDFARELFGLIRTKPESQWAAFKEGTIINYSKGYRADPKLLEKISDVVFALVKEWLEKMERGGVGSPQT